MVCLGNVFCVLDFTVMKRFLGGMEIVFCHAPGNEGQLIFAACHVFVVKQQP